MTHWITAPICDECWEKNGRGEQPDRILRPREETCLPCSQQTTSGIYVRAQVFSADEKDGFDDRVRELGGFNDDEPYTLPDRIIRDVGNFWGHVLSAMAANPEWRVGQAIVNTLASRRPDLSDQLRNSPIDCFYQNRLVGETMNFIQEHWNDLPQVPDTVPMEWTEKAE